MTLWKIYRERTMEDLLQHGFDGSAPTVRDEWVSRAVARADRALGAFVDVRPPWWHLPIRERLSVMANDGPGGVRIYTFCSMSLHPGVLVENLRRALRVVGSNPDELVKSWEKREGTMALITCIPLSRPF